MLCLCKPSLLAGDGERLPHCEISMIIFDFLGSLGLSKQRFVDCKGSLFSLNFTIHHCTFHLPRHILYIVFIRPSVVLVVLCCCSTTRYFGLETFCNWPFSCLVFLSDVAFGPHSTCLHEAANLPSRWQQCTVWLQEVSTRDYRASGENRSPRQKFEYYKHMGSRSLVCSCKCCFSERRCWDLCLCTDQISAQWESSVAINPQIIAADRFRSLPQLCKRLWPRT